MVETGSTTKVFGGFRTGKTQLALPHTSSDLSGMFTTLQPYLSLFILLPLSFSFSSQLPIDNGGGEAR